MMNFFYTYCGPGRTRRPAIFAWPSPGPINPRSAGVAKLFRKTSLRITCFCRIRISPAYLPAKSQPHDAVSTRGSVQCGQCDVANISFDALHCSVLRITLFAAAPVTQMSLQCHSRSETSYIRSTYLVPMHPTSKEGVRLSSSPSSRCRHKRRAMT